MLQCGFDDAYSSHCNPHKLPVMRLCCVLSTQASIHAASQQQRAATCQPSPRQAATSIAPHGWRAVSSPTSSTTTSSRQHTPAPKQPQQTQRVVTAAAGTSSSLPSLQLCEDLHPEQWQACVSHLQGLGFHEADAGVYIQRAFGWGAKARAYWRHEKVSDMRRGGMLALVANIELTT